jgi:hypothetical protein
MERLTKLKVEDENRIKSLLEDLTNKEKKLESKLENFKTELSKLMSGLNPAIEEYNEAANKINKFITDITDRQQNFHDTREDNWKNGEKGEYYRQWQGEWDLQCETIDFTFEISYQNEEANIDMSNMEQTISDNTEKLDNLPYAPEEA